ncbi:MAG: methylthioribulose 1-phosphate dehydratase [Microscillaceae bacterium]|nr:methylthioribulose 1-phosphate dehydratase [Microscillaceae bacterium]
MPTLTQLPEHQAHVQELIAIIHLFHQRGWSPATSTNYSFRNPRPYHETCTISSSGVDKLHFQAEDLMMVDDQGQPLPEYADRKPSAETLLHTMLYHHLDTEAILHTHSVASTVFSLVHQKDKIVKLTGFEVLKGIQGIQTHEALVAVPIFDNSQDIKALSEEIRVYFDHNPRMRGFLIAGHGLYAWGRSLAEAKRHVEVFEFVFECMNQMYGFCRQGGSV